MNFKKFATIDIFKDFWAHFLKDTYQNYTFELCYLWRAHWSTRKGKNSVSRNSTLLKQKALKLRKKWIAFLNIIIWNFFSVESIKIRFSIVFTPQSLLRMGYCRHCTRTYVRAYVRPKFFLDFWIFGIVTLIVLDDFFIFWKKGFFGPATPFFWPFFWYIRAYSGRAASQVIYAGKVLFSDFEST